MKNLPVPQVGDYVDIILEKCLIKHKIVEYAGELSIQAWLPQEDGRPTKVYLPLSILKIITHFPKSE